MVEVSLHWEEFDSAVVASVHCLGLRHARMALQQVVRDGALLGGVARGLAQELDVAILDKDAMFFVRLVLRLQEAFHEVHSRLVG